MLLIKIRSLVGVYYDEFSEVQGRNALAKALTCVWCTSLWVAIGFVVLYFYGIAFWIALPFALSTSAIIIERIVDGSR